MKPTAKTPKKATAPTYATPALDKGLDILEVLAHQVEGLTKSQLARELGKTVSEVFRMLICLERRGYIAQVTEERYSLTLKLFKLVQEHPPTQRLVVEALPVMQRLAHDILQSCHLGVLDGGRVVFIAQVNAPSDTGFFVKLGSSGDIMETSSGYVILAHQTPEQRERTLAVWARATGKKPPPDLERHLKEIRSKGYEKRDSYTVNGVVNITFPIFDERGSPSAALTVPHIQYKTSAGQRSEGIALLRNAAADITRATGGVSPAR